MIIDFSLDVEVAADIGLPAIIEFSIGIFFDGAPRVLAILVTAIEVLRLIVKAELAINPACFTM
ncbi:MAG: hypothetical protein HQM09_01540 [Candidatus Riflebacteria bacterium]|nr:hypothetical protein [Candidatus Riflebacteria bacterium]